MNKGKHKKYGRNEFSWLHGGKQKNGKPIFSKKLMEVSDPVGRCEFFKNCSFDEALQKNICDEAILKNFFSVHKDLLLSDLYVQNANA